MPLAAWTDHFVANPVTRSSTSPTAISGLSLTVFAQSCFSSFHAVETSPIDLSLTSRRFTTAMTPCVFPASRAPPNPCAGRCRPAR